MTTTVAHANAMDRDGPRVTYVARAVPRQGFDETSPYANPFRVTSVHGMNNATTHGLAVVSYRMACDFRTGLYIPELAWHLAEHVHELKDQTLTCWCAGRHGFAEVLTTGDTPWVCHGQFLAALADGVVTLTEAGIRR
jgi:hypothetical protein